jgi:hypothetical protein
MFAGWGQIIAAFLGVLDSPPTTTTLIKDWASIAQSGATVIAIFFGGIWFLWRRMLAQRISVAHAVVSNPIGHGKKLIRLTATLENKGEVRIKIKQMKAWLQQVSPIAPELLAKLKSDGNLRCEHKDEAGWPIVDEITCIQKDTEIEPGESHDLHFDFVINEDVESLLAYTYLRNEKKSDQKKPEQGSNAVTVGREIGWTKVTYHIVKEKP